MDRGSVVVRGDEGLLPRPCNTGIVRDEAPTAEEIAFFEALEELLPGVRDRYHKDSDGSLWMIASYDIPDVGVVHATLRCDFDGTRLRGGLSPSLLNRDDGLRADEAGIDTADDNGLSEEVTDPLAAAVTAAAWFRNRIAAHRQA